MKKILMLIACLASVNAYGGSIDYLAQQDSEYFAHPSMTGKIGTSAAFYNPAGTVFMEDGNWMKVNLQTISKDYTMNTNGDLLSPGQNGIHNSDYPSPMVPSFQFVSKKGDRSFFAHAGVAAGGGTLKYENGISAFEAIGNKIDGIAGLVGGSASYLGGTTVTGSSFYYNINFGMAQKLNEKFSVAGGIRLIYATRDLEGTGNFNLDLPNGIPNVTGGSYLKGNHSIDVNLDAKREAYGVGGVVGFDYKPTDRLNIGFKYESEIELDFEAKNGQAGLRVGSSNPIAGGFIDGILREQDVIKEWLVDGKRNLPAMMSLGVSYDLTDKFTVLASGNYYFIKDANEDHAYDGYDNGYEASIGFDYKLNEKYTLMGGYQYTVTGANENTYKDTDYALDAHMYCIGLTYAPDETKKYTMSYSFVDYIDGTAKGTGTTFEKTINAVGLSVEFKL